MGARRPKPVRRQARCSGPWALLVAAACLIYLVLKGRGGAAPPLEVVAGNHLQGTGSFERTTLLQQLETGEASGDAPPQADLHILMAAPVVVALASDGVAAVAEAGQASPQTTSRPACIAAAVAGASQVFGWVEKAGPLPMSRLDGAATLCSTIL